MNWSICFNFCHMKSVPVQVMLPVFNLLFSFFLLCRLNNYVHNYVYLSRNCVCLNNLDEFTPEMISSSFFGLQKMSGNSPSVLTMLEALCIKLTLSNAIFDSKSIGNTLFGLLVTLLIIDKNLSPSILTSISIVYDNMNIISLI